MEPMQLWALPKPADDADADSRCCQPQSQDLKPPTLLERDVLRAVGDVVLNEPYWWADRHDNIAWKSKKREIAMRVTRATLQDAAAHVLNWIVPLVREITDSTKREDLTLSRLVDQWPVEFADADPFSSQRRASLVEETSSQYDRYLVFAWAMLRGVCKRNEAVWPIGWGVSSCACWSLRPLVDAITDRGMETLKTLIAQREDGFDILPEDVKMILLAGDNNATQWLETTLFESVSSIRIDMVMVETWAASHLLSLIHDYELASVSKRDLVAVPAPFPNAFVVDGVDSTAKTLSLASKNAMIAKFSLDHNPLVAVETILNSTSDFPHLGPLLKTLMPAFKKIHAAQDGTAHSMVSRTPTFGAAPTWIGMIERPKLVIGQKAMRDSPARSTESWKPSRVIVDVETITVPAHSGPFTSANWCSNTSVQVMDSVKVTATAVICIQQTNVSVPELQIRSLSASNDMSLPPSVQELYMRSAMASGCGETNDGIAQVSAVAGRAVVLPPATQYRIANGKLVDCTKPGSVVLLRVALVDPKCMMTTSSIAARLLQPMEIPTWLEDLQLKARDHHLSAEEARLAHSNRDQQLHRLKKPNIVPFQELKVVQTPSTVPSLPRYVSRVFPVPPESLVSPDTHILERKMLRLIGELMNLPEWWTSQWADGSKARREWEQKLQNLYVSERLQSEVAEHYTVLLANFNSKVFKAVNSAESKSDDDDDRNGDEDDAFAPVVKLFSRFVMLKDVDQGFAATAKWDRSSCVRDVVDLVLRCRNAESSEAHQRIVSDFLGPQIPVEMFLPALGNALERVDDDVLKWMEQVKAIIGRRRLALKKEDVVGVQCPAEGTCVLDGALDRVFNTDLVTRLQPLLCQALTATENNTSTLCLVDPTCCVMARGQAVPTFSVPRTGSIDKRLAAVVVQNSDTNPFPRHVIRWIPSEVAVDDQGNARFLTYISNVSPRAHRGLYKSIDAIATAFVPLFEKLLSQRNESNERPIVWGQSRKRGREDTAAVTGQSSTLGVFNLRGRVIQMAVEMVQVELTPETPRYNGNLWNRACAKLTPDDTRPQVLATGVYFATVKNVTQPRVCFRPKPTAIAPWDFVDGYADRCLVFSNELEHKIESCQLIDAFSSGTVLLVKLHLIDPKAPTLSTANVRPSQREWIIDYTLGDVARYFNLPREVHNVIESMLEWNGFPAAELRAVLKASTGNDIFGSGNTKTSRALTQRDHIGGVGVPTSRFHVPTFSFRAPTTTQSGLQSESSQPTQARGDGASFRFGVAAELGNTQSHLTSSFQFR